MTPDPITCPRCGTEGHDGEACPNVPACPTCGSLATVRCACPEGTFSCSNCVQPNGQTHFEAPP